MQVSGEHCFFCFIASHQQKSMNVMKVHITVILMLIVETPKGVLHAPVKVGILIVEHLEIVQL